MTHYTITEQQLNDIVNQSEALKRQIGLLSSIFDESPSDFYIGYNLGHASKSMEVLVFDILNTVNSLRKSDTPTEQPKQSATENSATTIPEKFNTEEGKVYYDFYQQLDEPYKSQAIENYNEGFSFKFATPEKLSTSIINGFSWHYSPEKDEYWQILYDKIQKEQNK